MSWRCSETKRRALREQGALHTRPERVVDPLFEKSDFFDPEDLIQVKYEMLRRTVEAGVTVTEAAAAFGFSRPTFYKARAAFDAEGLSGLVACKRGPRGAHKLTDEVLAFLGELLAEDSSLSAGTLADRVFERFGKTVHPRSIERSLPGRKKNGGDACGAARIDPGGEYCALRTVACVSTPGWAVEQGRGVVHAVRNAWLAGCLGQVRAVAEQHCPAWSEVVA